MSSRRNFFVRAVAGVTGDVGLAVLVASACSWVIEAAALGWLLSFTVWLLGMLVMLAVSQYALHPVINLVLSDRKLDQAMAFASEAGGALALGAIEIWAHLQRHGIDLRDYVVSR